MAHSISGHTVRRVGRKAPVAAVIGAIVFASSALFGSPSGTRVALAQVDPGVMAQKLQQAIQTLTQPGSSQEKYEQAIEEALEAIYTSNLVVLPTSGEAETDTDDAFEVHRQMAQQAIDALTQHVDANGPGAGMAAEARNFIQVTSEAMEEIGNHTGAPGCLPTNPTACGRLNDPAQIPTLEDPVLGNAFQRPVRSPFPLVRVDGNAPPIEATITPGTMRRGDCTLVVKELRGVQAVVRVTTIPIWAEPWTARAHIIGTRLVWVWEWVPAEHIKTINYCLSTSGRLTQTVTQRIVLDRGALMFWRGLLSQPAG